MNSVVFEHVPVAELPAAWQLKLAQSSVAGSADVHVTVRIEAEEQTAASVTEDFVTDDPAFGIWRDREDVADVQAYIRRIRAPRFNRDGSCNELL
jgi:hypothetical protein